MGDSVSAAHTEDSIKGAFMANFDYDTIKSNFSGCIYTADINSGALTIDIKRGARMINVNSDAHRGYGRKILYLGYRCYHQKRRSSPAVLPEGNSYSSDLGGYFKYRLVGVTEAF